MKYNKAFFLDRDGVLNEDKGYVYKIKDFKWLPGTIKAIKILNKKKFKVIVITNQSGIGRKYYTAKDVKKLHKWINKQLKNYQAKIDDFYYCPHHPKEAKGKYKKKCKCRKPNNLMVLKAKKKWNIKINESFMIGDKLSDKKCANKSNLKFFYRSKKDFSKQIKKIIN